MANDVTRTTDSISTNTNGALARESVIERAIRILNGDIHPDDYLSLPPEETAKVEWEFEIRIPESHGV